MSTKKQAAGTASSVPYPTPAELKAAQVGFYYQDYRDAFLAIFQGLLTHNGLNMASAEHFAVMVGNVDELAMAAEKAMRRRRQNGDNGADPLAGTVEVFEDPEVRS